MASKPFVVDPSYRVTPRSNLDPRLPEAPGFWKETGAKWRQGWAPKTWAATNALVDHKPDPDFNRWSGLEGYEEYAPELIDARSKGEQDAMKRIIDQSLRDRRIAANGSWGLITDLMAGVADPVNIIPIPVVKGIGMLRGAAVSAGIVGGTTVGTEVLRGMADPTVTGAEMVSSVAFGTLFGGAIGGVAGGMGARQRAAARRLDAALSDVDMMNPTLEIRAGDESMVLRRGERPARNADGTRPKVSVTEEPDGFKMATHNGVNYVFDDGDWILAADRGRDVKRAVSQDIKDDLGAPVPEMKTTLRIDQAYFSQEFERADWRPEMERYLPEDVNVDQAIRNAKDFEAVRTLQHLHKMRLERLPNETDVDFEIRVGKKAMAEALASRTSVKYGLAAGMEWFMERLNRSPMAKAWRVAGGDNVVGDFALRVAGDFGVALKANEYGYRTPPSILLKGMRHTVRWAQFKDEFDVQWLKYASEQQQQKGTKFQGWNVSAAGYALRAGAKKLTGQNVLTYGEFSEMVGKAVYLKGDFEHAGFRVVPEARKAAEAYTRMMQEYDDLFRAEGMYADQKGTLKVLNSAKKEASYFKDKVARWLWGQSSSPSALRPAIKVNDQVFTGATHEEAIQNMLDELGEEGDALIDGLGPDNYGYVSRETQAPRASMQTAEIISLADVRAKLQSEATMREAEALMRRLSPEDLETLQGDITRTDWSQVSKLPKHLDDEFREWLGEYGPEAEGMMAAERINETHARFLEDHFERVAEDIGNDNRKASMEDDFVDGTEGNDLWEGSRPWRGVERPDYQPIDEDFIEVDAYNLPPTDPAFGEFTTIVEALAHIESKNYAGINALIRRIKPLLRDVTLETSDDPGIVGALGVYDPNQHIIRLRRPDSDTRGGHSIEVVLHEAVHAATYNRIQQGINDINDLVDSPYGRIVTEIKDLGVQLREILEIESKANPDAATNLFGIVQKAMHGEFDEHEILTYALTSVDFRHFLRQYRIQGENVTGWQKVKQWIAQLLGLSKKEMTALDVMLDANDRLLALPFSDDPRAGGVPKASMATDSFIKQQDLIEQREASLSPRQRVIYDRYKTAWDDAEAMVAQTEEQLAKLNENQHRFTDANGNPENYYNRYFDKSQIATNREAFTRLIEVWYRRDNSEGARSRAEETVHKMITEDFGSARARGAGPGMRSLNQRSLNIPNSWSIEDPEFGTIAMADFIDNNIIATSETYVRRGGIRLEMAKMFGDADGRMEMNRVRQHLNDKHIAGLAEDDADGLSAAEALISEVTGWLDLTVKSATGTIRTGDPYAWHNRLANVAMDFTTLSVMGRVIMTAIPEAFRNGMVNGFGVAFRTVFMRHLDDMENLRGNLEFNALTGELLDMVKTRANMRIAEESAGETAQGGTWFEKQLAAAIPGFFKITGLTTWTTYVKDLTMLSAQHSVMADARRIGAAIASGSPPSAADARRLAALGINERDALLLSRMPVDIKPGGKLILPAIGQWTGGDGRRASEALLTAIHAEARRAIVTPSFGDKSTAFSGVWSRKGKAVAETDIMRLPMQFMGYGVAAHNKVLVSALQGRDRNTIGGTLMLMLGGMFAVWAKTPKTAWEKKDYTEILLEGYEAAGIGGFWFGDLHQQVEQMTGNRFGIRPTLGMDPKFGKAGEKYDPTSAAGAAPGLAWDVAQAFLDPTLTSVQRAQLIRRGVPYNNVIWWNSIFRSMAENAGEMFGGDAQ